MSPPFFKHNFNARILITLIIQICIIPTNLTAQEENFSIPDSLKTLTFSELRDKVSVWYLKRKSKELRIYANTYFKKALEIKDSLKIAEGYEFLSYTVYLEPKEEYYIDKAIEYSKGLDGYFMPCTAYYIKAGINSDRNDFKAELDYLLLSHDAAIKARNIGLISRVKYDLGWLKNRIGEYDEALEYAKDRWDYIKFKRYDTTYLASLFLLSITHSYANYLDEATRYNKYGIALCQRMKNESYYAKFVLLEGVNQYFKRNYIVAIDSLKNAIPQLIKDELVKSVAASYMYIGRSYLAIKKDEAAVYNLKKMDSIFDVTGHLLPYSRDGYKDLIKYAKKNSNLEDQLYYTNQLLKLDSILDSNYKHLSSTIYKKFESVELVKEKEKLIGELDKKNKITMYYVFLLITLVGLVFIGFIYNYIKRKRDRKKFITIIESAQKEEDVTGLKKKPSTLDISQDIINKVLQKLKQFETNEEFLKQNITLNTLSKKTQTNSKYVSKIINVYKKKSATNYVNNLRIEYAITRLKNDSMFRKFTIKSIANEVGYSNSQSFSTAFYKKTGLKPSYFIKEVEKNNLNVNT